MTTAQKEQILSLRGKGESYGAIADTLHLPKYTVKSYCRRNCITQTSEEKGELNSLCDHCGQPLMQTPGVRKRRFCSDQCRMQWWYRHPESMQRSTEYHFTCPVCGKEFKSYGNPKRIYCSRSCFGVARKTTRG